MSIVTGFEVILVLLALLAIALTWYWWRQTPLYAPLPPPFCDRDSQAAEWRERFDDELLQKADAVLLLVCDAFCFNPEERYKLKPDDQVMDVYRGRYAPSKKWPKADCMEVETLIFTFNKKFGTETSQWNADVTLAQLVDLATKQRQVKDG
jgi:hypothetical protein